MVDVRRLLDAADRVGGWFGGDPEHAFAAFARSMRHDDRYGLGARHGRCERTGKGEGAAADAVMRGGRRIARRIRRTELTVWWSDIGADALQPGAELGQRLLESAAIHGVGCIGASGARSDDV